MSEFGGLRKHKKTQHALVGLGSADVAAAVALPGKAAQISQKWAKGIIKWYMLCKASVFRHLILKDWTLSPPPWD